MPEDDARTLSRQRFGQFAERYVRSEAHSAEDDLQRLVEIARPQPAWHVLDVATGGGHTALCFSRHVARVVATDLAPAMLAAARRHIEEARAANVSYALADAHALPFPSGRFDLTTCRIAPHHFPEIARFAREAARVTAPPGLAAGGGGCVLIQDHVLPDDAPAAAYIDAFERARDPSHHQALTEREWVHALEDAGLEVTRVEQVVKRHDFASWVARQDCPPAVVERLIEMMRGAPPAARAWMAPRDWDTPRASFANHHIVIAGRKRR